ncbi:class I SAM-dependent methyltransferase (plasmid) [[Kitasatospora] papulosa]|uniref:class I SAM-dependent methyltransferase n=1 Tax=[Kitasatospora] papulosa TaxID=1464011 RepID=UPI002F911411
MIAASSSPPGPAPEQEDVFDPTAGDYARCRPGVPASAVRLLTEAVRHRPDPVLLDLGTDTGTGQVPRALLTANHPPGRIEAVDVSRPMLERARRTLTPLLDACTLRLVHAAADAYTLPPGGDIKAVDLITCCRSLHWMDRAAVLTVADRVAAPGATLAIMGDGSLWTHGAAWTHALKHLIQQCLGTARRARSASTYDAPRRSSRQDLLDSPWTDITEHQVPVQRDWTPAAVVGYLRSTSYAQPRLFGQDHAAFEQAATDLLESEAYGGVLTEHALFTVLLARRPGRSA